MKVIVQLIYTLILTLLSPIAAISLAANSSILSTGDDGKQQFATSIALSAPRTTDSLVSNTHVLPPSNDSSSNVAQTNTLILSNLRIDTAAIRQTLQHAPTFHFDTLLVKRRSAFAHLSPVWQISIPVGLTALGAWGVVDRGWWYKRRLVIKKQFMKWHTSGPFRADDYIQYAPFTSYLCAAFYPGVYHRHNFRDRLILGATTYAIMGILVNATKYSVGSLRPDGSARNSFPSGHTATAVMGAELVRIEYGNQAGWGAYAVAATVGVLRMYNNRHWINDVLGGVAFGFASARLGLLLLPLEKRLFGLEKKKNNKALSEKSAFNPPMLLPTYDAFHRTAGFTASWTF